MRVSDRVSVCVQGVQVSVCGDDINRLESPMSAQLAGDDNIPWLSEHTLNRISCTKVYMYVVNGLLLYQLNVHCISLARII